MPPQKARICWLSEKYAVKISAVFASRARILSQLYRFLICFSSRILQRTQPKTTSYGENRPAYLLPLSSVKFLKKKKGILCK